MKLLHKKYIFPAVLALVVFASLPSLTHAQCYDDNDIPVDCGSATPAAPAQASNSAPANASNNSSANNNPNQANQTSNPNTSNQTSQPNTANQSSLPNTSNVSNLPNTSNQYNNPVSSGGAFFLQNPLSSQYSTVGGIVSGFLGIFSYLVVLFAVLALIWVGLQFVLAQGNSDRLKELKNWLLYIVIGVAIVIGARIIVNVVITTLQATGTVSPNVISNAQNALQGN